MRRRLGLWLLRGYEFELPYESDVTFAQPFGWRFASTVIIASGLAASSVVCHSIPLAMGGLITMAFATPAYLGDTIRGITRGTL